MKKTFAMILVLAAMFYFWKLKSTLNTFSDEFNNHAKTQIEARTNLEKIRTPAQLQNASEDIRSPLEIAAELIQIKKEEWKIQNYHELRSTEVVLPLGTKITFSIFQDNIPVQGQNIQVMISKRGKILSVDNNYLPLEKADIVTSDFSEVASRLKDKFEVADLDKTHDPVLYAIPGINKPELAYSITIKSAKGPEVEVLVRGSDGEILVKTPARKEF